MRVLHYFKLLICTLGTDVNIKKIVYCYKCGVSVWVFSSSSNCLSGANYSCFTLRMQIKCMKGQMMAKITRIFAQNLGQAPKEAEFYSFSNAIQHFLSL